MRKSILLLGCLLIISASLNAQIFDLDAPKTFVTLEVTGTVNIKNVPNVSKLAVGMILSESATLKVTEGASASLTMDGHLLTFNEKGTYKLKKEAKKLRGETSDDNFLAMVNAVSGFNKGGGGDDTTQDGWGKISLNNIMPIDGVVPMEATTFSWAGDSPKAFMLTIIDPANNQTVFSVRTRNKEFTVDLTQLDLVKEAEYHWFVTDADNPRDRSVKSDVNFIDGKEVTMVLDDLKNDEDFKNSSDWLKALRKAHALDSNKMVSKAYEKYLKAVKKFPDNEVVKDMTAKFFADHGIWPAWEEMQN